MTWEMAEDGTSVIKLLDPEQYFAHPQLAIAEADIELAFADVNPDDTEALYTRFEQIADDIHADRL